jgi:tRNA (cmo5U34)-methyltransferase
MNKKDQLFRGKNAPVPFEFNEQVTEVFPDMIRRSVPGYQDIIQGIGRLAKHFVSEGSRVYDLGCSLGAASLAIRQGCPDTIFELVAVDASEPMANRCRDILAQFRSQATTEVLCADILHLDLQPCDFVVLNFTLQFIPLDRRASLLQRIAQAIRPGGALVLSEKICFRDARVQTLMTRLHEDFKRDNGYSDLEIAGKRAALEHVLVPEDADTHRQRLLEAGFASVAQWHQQLNFSSWIALR